MLSDQQLSAATSERIARCFRDIETTRMADVPILNQSLNVEVVGLRDFGDEWFCILITPWFMNVMLLSRRGVAPGEPQPPIGSKQTVAFPAGRFEMICGSEPDLGAFRMCSLFSPMLEFADQDSAVATANAAIQAIMNPNDPGAATDEPDMEMIWRGERPTDEQIKERALSQNVTQDDKTTADPQPAIDTPATSHLDRRHLLFGQSPQGKTR